MLLPALGKARDSARTTSCINMQKQCALTALTYADDNNNWLFLPYQNNKAWGKFLCDNGYPIQMKQIRCPSQRIDPSGVGSWYHTIGFCGDITHQKTDDSFKQITLADSKIYSPSMRWFFSDSIANPSSWWSYGWQQSFWVNWCAGTSWRIHIRHNSKAVRAFLDGSVRPQTASEIVNATIGSTSIGDSSTAIKTAL